MDGSSLTTGSLPLPVPSVRTASLLGGAQPARTALLLVYDRALAASERAAVESYVNSKWHYR